MARHTNSTRAAVSVQRIPVFLISRNGVRTAGGVERVVQLVQEALSRDDIDVTLVDEASITPPWLAFGRFGQFVFPVWVSLWLWCKRLAGRRFITISNSSYTPLYPAEVIIVHGSAAGYIKALAGTGKRFLGMRMMACLEAMSMRAAKRVACVSETVRDFAVDLYQIAPGKCEVVHNGIDTSIFRQTPKFSGNRVRLGFAGRLEFGKGLPYLIEIAHWVELQKDFSLVIATINDAPPELANLANVTIMKQVSPENMGQFYDKIDVFLLPSLFEGFELVTLEAIASGVCVLGTQVGACKLFLEQGNPWVRELPRHPADFPRAAPALIGELRKNYDPQAMNTFMSVYFSTERFTTQIRRMALEVQP